MLTATAVQPGFAHAVQLRDGADGVPALFLLPGLGGTTLALLELSAAIVPPFKIYGFQPRGADGAARPDSQVEAMVDRYLAELTRLQPRGPYYLCGHSFGGLVAFEMARRLRAAGADVAALILLDTPLHWSFWPRGYFMTVLAQRLWHHLSVILAMPRSQIVRYTAQRTGSLVNMVLSHLHMANKRVTPDRILSRALQDLWDCQLVAMSHYCPRFYPGRMVYCEAMHTEWTRLDVNAVWRRRVRDLEVRRVAGGHRSMLDHPHVAGLASTVAECLMPAP
jgi:acetoacetyl-CoA synthetase